MPLARSLVLATLLLTVASPVFADITGFLGTTSTPTNRSARGFALGVGLLVVGFEFEFATTSEELEDLAPGLLTGMGNVLLQTPFPIFGMQFYFTTGGGGYRETLGDTSETQFAMNTGTGVKISLLGPVRARVDYRLFKLRGEPLHDTVHRAYAGLNVSF